LADLRDAVKDPSPKVRAAAVKAVGEIISDADADGDVELLITVLKDTDESVVLSAIDSLQGIRIPRDAAVPVLTEIYRNEKSSPELRSHAVWALESICSPESIAIFLDDLHTGGKTLSFTAAEALKCALNKRADPAAFAPILKAIQSQPLAQWNSLEQTRLIDALGETKNPDALAPLTEIVKSPVRDIRGAAVGALGSLGDARAIPVLAGLLKDYDENVRMSATWALSQFSNFSAPPELIAALRDASTTVQMQAARALVLSNDPKAIDALLGALATNPTAIYVLGESRDPRVVPALIVFLQNATNKTADRASAATALGKLGDQRAVDPLIASLNEDNGMITMQASSALGQLKDKRAIEPLKQALARWRTRESNPATTFIIEALLALGVTDVTQ
jgi:HEAT repeat protein